MKLLIILDLDHTLIYGSYAETETAELLFQYHKYLKVYKRHLAKELIKLCHSKSDIIVYTTALRRYAKKICNLLDIQPIELLSRKNCTTIDGKLRKEIKPEWIANYNRILIIDDSPNVWIANNDQIDFLVPDEFRGQANDLGLEKIITKLKSL
jgi:hypothetical protein